MTNELITPQILLAIISSLIICLGTIIWHFFKKMYDKLDKSMHFMHEMELRLTEKIEKLDDEHNRTKEALAKLFTQVGKLEGVIFGKEAI